MHSPHFVLMVIAILFLFLAAIGRPNNCAVGLGWLGMAFWALSLLIT